MPDFSALTEQEIQVGRPTRKELFRKIKDSLDNLLGRVLAMEAGAVTREPIGWDLVGSFNAADVRDGFVYLPPLDRARTLTSFKIFVRKAGSSGVLTVDVEYKRGGGGWTSILTAPASADFSGGDLYTTAGTLAVTSLLAGDILRLNLDSLQANMEDFSVYMENEVA